MKATKLAKDMDDGLEILDLEFKISEIESYLGDRKSNHPPQHAYMWDSDSEAAEEAFEKVAEILLYCKDETPIQKSQELKKRLTILESRRDRERLKREITAEVRREFEGR